MAHYCICKICNQKFDRDKIQAVKCGVRRYAHYNCYPEGELVPLGPEIDPDMTALKNYISKIYGDKARWPLIMKQIKSFQEKGFTTSGMLGTLIYFYEIKNGSVNSSNGGIGIIEYTYEDARNFYENIQQAQDANKGKTLLNEIKEIIIKPPKMRGLKQQFFDLGELENEE